MAGCPSQICTKCGKAREKVYDIERVATRPEPLVSKYGDIKNDIRGGDGIRLRKEVMRDDKGYTDCGCDSPFYPGTVLDPFCGSGTTLAVAKRLNRKSVCIELNPDYCKLAQGRISKIAMPMELGL